MALRAASPTPPPAVDEAPNVVAPPASLMAWVRDARAGDEFIYASRAGLFATKSATLVAARTLMELKLVSLTQRAIPGTLQRNYVARRTAVPFREKRAAEPAPARDFLDDEAAKINAILPVLAQMARFSRPCPTDHQLAERTGVAREDVKQVMDAMCELGMIRVRPAPAPTLRQVTIVATGHRTGIVG